MNPQILLKRLDDIGRSLEQSGHALALIGLGSVGVELVRLDEYSDLDFFVIVEDGYKANYLDSLRWLSDVHPITYRFLNTVDGYKLLFQDGIFCEFAVFESEELSKMPFAPGRVVWKRAEIPAAISQPVFVQYESTDRSREWLLGEALTNLYVGLGREKRGERLSATRFIQGYAVDRLIELTEQTWPAADVPRDLFVRERRFERRFPDLAPEVGSWMQGYDRNRESASAILNFLEKHFEVDQEIAKATRELSD